jgi:lysophospholipase L1-like esterase
MNRRRCWLVALLAVLGLLIGPLPAYAAPRTLVALGDSYGAGVGSYIYFNDGTDCFRSPFAYPSQIAAAKDLSLTLAACSGATTFDVLDEQLELIKPGTNYVTITVGGNDVGFRTAISQCALPGWLGNCSATIAAGLNTLRTDLPDRLARVYSEVKERAPGATVVVTGYPLLFNETDCNPLTFFTAAEMKAINSGTIELNAAIQKAATEAGFRFVDAVPAFIGHAWCDPHPWINGLTFPVVNSFHPNIAGHTVYAVLVGRALFGSPVTTDARPLAAGAARLPAVTSAQGPTRIRVPDLKSPEVAKAAARAGVTKADLRRLLAAQRNGASNAQLDRLDAKITAAAAHRHAAGR